MSLEPPTYLSSLQNNIRARPIPWDGAVRAGNITDEHLRKIKAVDKVRKQDRKQTVEADVTGYTALLAGSPSEKSVLESASKRHDIVQYILVLAGDLINGMFSYIVMAASSFSQFANSFYADAPALASALVSHPKPFNAFLPLLRHSNNPEDPIPLLTASFLTNLVSASLISSSQTSESEEEALPQLYSYLATLTKNQDSGLQDIGVQGFSALLRNKSARELFWKQRKETVDALVEILRTAAAGGKDNGSTTAASTATGSARSADISIGGGVGLQLLYHVLLVIWQLSFEGSLVGEELQS
jgi:V-type H+-transporting ATPase subunit H